MNSICSVARSFRAKLRDTLTSPLSPEFPHELAWILTFRQTPQYENTSIGTLPIRLQHLCVLALKLEEVFNTEKHRRCVNFFDSEEYDNEMIEYRIYCEVQADPAFNKAPLVWGMLERRVRRLWRNELTTVEGYDTIFFIDQHFNVRKTKYRLKTPAELEQITQKLLEDLKEEGSKLRVELAQRLRRLASL